MRELLMMSILARCPAVKLQEARVSLSIFLF